MKKYEVIDKLIQEESGTILLESVIANGISKQYFYEYAKKIGLQKVAQGIYVSPDTWEDSMYLLQLKCPQIVFSHESALYLWNMADREPTKTPVTVKTNYNSKYLKELEIDVHRVKEEFWKLGVTETETMFGNIVKLYDRERTICDVIRNRNNMDSQAFQTALKEYVRYPEKNLYLLTEYAQILKVEKVLKTYMEVLL